MRFNPDYTRPWSVANTPLIQNPMLPFDQRIGELMEIVESPVPWRYVERGFVLWEGPSPVDGAPLVAIVTGVKPSGNVKTGAMLQTWILRRDMSPQEAVDTGADISICGYCKHRGFEIPKAERKKKPRRVVTAREAARGVGIAGGPPTRQKHIEQVMGGRTCYVVVAQAPMSVWKAYHRGVYPRMPLGELPLLGYNRVVRLGSYGDPAMVPTEVWAALTEGSLGWTGYTHQWREPWAASLRPYVMASADDERDLHQAQSMGWRTFRVLRGDEQLIAGLEMTCPASAEGGQRRTCDACRMCQGAMPGKAPWRQRPGIVSVAIKVHPRFQVLYYPRGKKGKKIRAHKVSDRPTKLDPKKKPSEIVLVDYVAGAEVKSLRKLMQKAEKSKDPAAVIDAARHEFPDHFQGYLDAAPAILAPGGKRLPTLSNPTAGQLEGLIFRKREELDDAKFFKRSKAEVKKLGKELKGLESRLAKAAKAIESDVRRGMAETRRGIAHDEWRFGLGRRNPHFDDNPTKAEELIAKAIRPCMTRDEAYRAATSIERSLALVQRHKIIPAQVKNKITKLTWRARDSKTPPGRVRALSAANRMLQQLRSYGAGSKRPSKGYKRRRRERKDPRLGHLFFGPELSPEALERRRAYESEVEIAANPLLAIVGNPRAPVRGNPLLAIVGNPRAPVDQRTIDVHRREAMKLIHQALEEEDFRPLRLAHERLQAAYRCCSNPPNPEDQGVLDDVLAEIDAAEDVLFAGIEAVARSGKRGRVKKQRRKPTRKNKPKRGKGKPVKRYSIEEARDKFDGFDEAYKAYKRFHGREPGHVDLYELEDGYQDERVEPVHAALHRRLETNYIVPWDSNKKGSLWKHEHIEGALKGEIDLDARAEEDLPLDIFNPFTEQMITMPNSRWHVTDWHRERGAKLRRH